MTEEQLVKSPCRGELSALEGLVRRYTPYIYVGSNPNAGTFHSLIAGGTPGRYGFSKDLQSQWLESALDALGILEQPGPYAEFARLSPGIYFVDQT